MEHIVVADDHPLFRAALASALMQAAPEARIDECDSLADARRALSARSVDLLLLDLKLSDVDGFAGLAAVRGEFPAVPVAVVSASEDAATIRRALAFGAAGGFGDRPGHAFRRIRVDEEQAHQRPHTIPEPASDGRRARRRWARKTTARQRPMMRKEKSVVRVPSA